MIRLTHVITNLETGGAQRMLANLLAATDRSAFDVDVVSLGRTDAPARRIEALGVPVRSLGLRPRRPSPAAAARLARLLAPGPRRVVQSWMYHADLAASVATGLGRRAGLVWGLHNSNLDPASSRWSTRATVRLLAFLSRRAPARIVSCSEAAARLHASLGYDAARMVLIPNGLDTEEFRPDPAARRDVRRELGVAETTRLVGLVGRFDPQKDHETFARAAGRVASASPEEVRFVLCGEGLTPDNGRLRAWLADAGVLARCHLLGPRDDIPRLTASFDAALSSSAYGEAHPMVLLEALACGVPCVATDVGDAARLVGDAGRVAPPRDPAALAEACLALLALPDEERRRLGEDGRRRVAREHGLPATAARYAALYREIADGREVR